jgi:hypothetical protein
MNAREFAAHNLLREARQRIHERHRRTAPSELSRALACARAEMAPLDATIRVSQRRAELAAFIRERFGHEDWPEDMHRQIAVMGLWRRELAEMARREGMGVE